MTETYLLVGLGNPGLRYRLTRHNAGFLVVDYLSEEHRIKVKKKRCAASIGEGTIAGKRVVLAKPCTYMNRSGESVASLLEHYRIGMERLVVVYDDMDLEIGAIRIRKKGGSGTHNGMRSVISCLGNGDFLRIRVGIGKPEHDHAVSYVLGRIPKAQQEEMFLGIKKAADAFSFILEEGIEIAMGHFN